MRFLAAKGPDDRVPRVSAVASGLACDEYPFCSSAQSGPGASPEPNPLLKNRSAGTRYFAFKNKCGWRAGDAVAVAQVAIGSPFLVIPMAFLWAPPAWRYVSPRESAA